MPVLLRDKALTPAFNAGLVADGFSRLSELRHEQNSLHHARGDDSVTNQRLRGVHSASRRDGERPNKRPPCRFETERWSLLCSRA